MGQFYGMAAAWRRMGIINHIQEEVGDGLVGLQAAVLRRCSVPNMVNGMIVNWYIDATLALGGEHL